MRVRQATLDDAAAIAGVEVASWRAAYRDIMPATYLRALSVEEKTASWAGSLGREQLRGKRTLVVEDGDGAVAGYATVGPDQEAGSGLLYLMYVSPEHWGQGAGRMLMQAARQALSSSATAKPR